MENKITKIEAEEIKNSKGQATIRVTVRAGGASGSFAVPSGASIGVHEAHVLPIEKAIENVENIIAPALLGQDVADQRTIDKIMLKLDGTNNKDKLGGNAMIGVSVACAKAAAKIKRIEVFEYLRTLAEIFPRSEQRGKPSRQFPRLFMNLLEGGKHTSNILAFQEFLVVPDTNNIPEAVHIGIKIQDSLREMILAKLGEESIILGDEGGFALKTSDIRAPLVFLTEAIKKNNLEKKVKLALDVAASSFYEKGNYKIAGKNVSKEELMGLYESLTAEFDIFSIEDPFHEEDFESFAELKKKNSDLLIVGDDLTVSNSKLLKKAIEKESINAMIIKPNQIGTLTETLETMKLARENDIELIVSHRGEETDDDFIADLAFAFGCFGLKAGSPQKPERMVKYKRLIEISKT